MPTIAEDGEDLIMDEANNNRQPDFSHLLALPEIEFGESNEVPPASIADQSQPVCPSHPGGDCLCYGFMTDLDYPDAPAPQPATSTGNVPEPNYAAFEQWIPRFARPEKPCDYCRFKRLQCYLGTGESSCAPCRSLFRECSLTNSNTLEASNYADKPLGEYLDTLHPVDEDTCREWGTFTGLKQLRSKTRGPGTTTPVGQDDAPGSSKRNGIRFPRAAIKTLKDWLDLHQDHPYPTEEEKAELERQTELTPTQIANWLANARRRRKVANKNRPKVAMSPSLKPTTPAIAVPRADKPWEELNPFERWKHSPPTNEPAAITDIANALAHSEFDGSYEPASPSSYSKQKGSSSGFSGPRAPSTTSIEASSNSISGISSGANSHGSSHGSFSSFGSSLAGKKSHRRRRRQAATQLRNPSDNKKRMFQCTFCCDSFRSKYDWTRHEKSLHLSLETWRCCPLGPKIADPRTGVIKCVYCNVENPSQEHLESHNHRQCEDKGAESRIFFRKDHLRQHLRLMHGCEMSPSMEAWKSVASEINSRCGFCAQRFTQWHERCDHLAIHFKAGARMSEWRGCRGLDPAVAAQVTNAMPPYLIGMESMSPDPFSATKSSHVALNHVNLVAGQGESINNALTPSQRQKIAEDASRGNNSTCWEILTVRLGKYANEMASKGVVMTDEMLQRQARLLLFDSDDPWNQTAADNREWLDLFKKAHGLDMIPSQVGGRGLQVPDDLEWYGDLGLRIPFVVQLQAYNKEQQQRSHCLEHMPETNDADVSGVDRTRHVAQTFYRQLADANLLHESSAACAHPECSLNVVDLNTLDPSRGQDANPHRRWCTYELPLDKARLLGRANGNLANAGILGGPKATKTTAGGSDASQAAQAQAYNDMSFMQEVHHHHGAETRDNAYLPYHRYELPFNRAQEFASITPAWQESGEVPASIATSTMANHSSATPTVAYHNNEAFHFNPQPPVPSFDLPSTTTNLPFPLEGTADMNDASHWNLDPNNNHDGAVDQRMLQELDELIAASTGAEMAGTAAPASGGGLFDFDFEAVGKDAVVSAPGRQVQGIMAEDFSFDDLVFDMEEDGAGKGGGSWGL